MSHTGLLTTSPTRRVHGQFFTTQAACEAFAPKYHAKFPDETLTPCSKMQ